MDCCPVRHIGWWGFLGLVWAISCHQVRLCADDRNVPLFMRFQIFSSRWEFTNFDDDVNFVQNTHLSPLTLQNLWWMFHEGVVIGVYEPVGGMVLNHEAKPNAGLPLVQSHHVFCVRMQCPDHRLDKRGPAPILCLAGSSPHALALSIITTPCVDSRLIPLRISSSQRGGRGLVFLPAISAGLNLHHSLSHLPHQTPFTVSTSLPSHASILGMRVEMADRGDPYSRIHE